MEQVEHSSSFYLIVKKEHDHIIMMTMLDFSFLKIDNNKKRFKRKGTYADSNLLT